MQTPVRIFIHSLILLLLTPLHGAFAQGTDALVDGREHARRALDMPRYERLFRATQAAAPRDYDVLHYRLDVSVDPAGRTIEGYATVTVQSRVDGLDAVALDLRDEVTATSVEEGGSALAFAHHNHVLDVTLAGAADTGEELTLRIGYHGPIATSLQTAPFVVDYHNGTPIVYNFSGAPYWFPCNDRPDDKATTELDVTVPAGLVVASNGTLVDTIESGDETTFVWREDYPISTYLMSVAITNYHVVHDTYTASDGRTMDLAYYVYPEHESGALNKFGVTRDMIGAFAGMFGEYPFIDEKYGMAEVPIGVAGMEHQTMTSIGDGVIPSPYDKDWLIAHELAHQWWGDLVTYQSQPYIWLNEGFASYSESLWLESQNGAGAYHDHMDEFEKRVTPGAIYDPNNPYGINAYYKGAWVLHMLRHVVGDNVFKDILPAYAERFAYSNATTDDFRGVCEDVSGMDLQWFFDQWITQRDRPEYQYSWYSLPSDGGREVFLTIAQSQKTGLFRMPVDVGVTTSNGARTVVVHDDERVQHFQFSVDGDVAALTLDPGDWILKTAEEVPPPLRAVLDVMPGSCQNPVNTTVFDHDPMNNDDTMRGGVLPVALLGSDDFDVSRVDMLTIRLEGAEPLRHQIADVAGLPAGVDPCPTDGPDGHPDIQFKFRKQDLADVLQSTPRGGTFFVTLTGTLDDGTPFVANDRVKIAGEGQGPQRHEESATATRVTLGEPVPNPFNPTTRIPYELPAATRVTLSVYDVGGRLIDRLVDGPQSAGHHTIQWNAAGHASGIYFCRLTAEGITQVKRLVVVK